jgi:chromosome segregation ATPase
MTTITLLVGLLLSGAGMTPAGVQSSTPASTQERAASLRAQLGEVQAKQTALQTRLQQLEEDLKPESLEHSLAGVGSTHPEELREQRRRQLERERTSVQAQLNLLAASRTRLETAIAEADAQAYQQSAGIGTTAAQPATNKPPPNAPPVQRPVQRTNKNRRSRRKPHRRLSLFRPPQSANG